MHDGPAGDLPKVEPDTQLSEPAWPARFAALWIHHPTLHQETKSVALPWARTVNFHGEGYSPTFCS